MQLADLLKETLETDSQDVRENERTPTSVRRFGVRLHTAGLSIRGTVAILELLGVDRSHGAVWNWIRTFLKPRTTRRRQRRRGSRLTRNKSKSMVRKSGPTLRST